MEQPQQGHRYGICAYRQILIFGKLSYSRGLSTLYLAKEYAQVEPNPHNQINKRLVESMLACHSAWDSVHPKRGRHFRAWEAVHTAKQLAH